MQLYIGGEVCSIMIAKQCYRYAWLQDRSCINAVVIVHELWTHLWSDTAWMQYRHGAVCAATGKRNSYLGFSTTVVLPSVRVALLG